jgi:hypothetical protein
MACTPQSEIVTALDAYMRAVMVLLPRPAVMAAFLESDIHKCGTRNGESAGFDVVSSVPGPGQEKGELVKPLTWYETVKTSEASFQERTKLGELRCSVYQASDGMVLPLSAPPLNYLGQDWREQLVRLQHVEAADGILDAVGMKAVSSSPVVSGPDKGES